MHRENTTLNDNLEILELSKADFKKEVIAYHIDQHIHPVVENLTNEELAYMCIGAHHQDSKLSILGSSALHIAGASGETTNHLANKLDGKYLTMVDGPAGIRVAPNYVMPSRRSFASRTSSHSIRASISGFRS